MNASNEEYGLDINEYSIIYTLDSIVVDYKRTGHRTIHLFMQGHQMIQMFLFLLDNCSIIDITCNLYLVTDIHEVDQCCIITTNTCNDNTNLKVTLKSSIFPLKKEVLFNYNGISNNISLHFLQDYFKVSFSNWFGLDCNKFVIIKPDCTKMKFTMSI